MALVAFVFAVGRFGTAGAQDLTGLCPCAQLPATTYLAGTVDGYAAPNDPAFRGQELNSAFPNNIWKTFDDTTVNAHVGYTFANLPRDIVCADLEIRLRPTGDLSDNDTVYLGLNPALNGLFDWATRLHFLPGAGGTWNPPLNLPAVHFDLASLPATGIGASSLLARINADQRLDVLVQDDTVVDYIRLTVRTFPEQVRTAGIADLFAPPVEATSRGIQLDGAFPLALWKNFDDPAINRFVGHTFGNLSGNVVQASLEARLQPTGNASSDSLYLGLGANSTFAFGSPITSLPGTGGTWNGNPATTFTFDLAALSNGADLRAKINADDRLDFLVQDDTNVDYLRLRYRTCPAAPSLAGFRHTPLGVAAVTPLGDHRILIRNLGEAAEPENGVRIEVGGAGTLTIEQTLDRDATPLGAAVISTMVGSLDGVPERPLARIGMRRTPAGFTALVDYSPLGSEGYHAKFFDRDGDLVFEGDVSPDGTVAAEAPILELKCTTTTGKNPDGSTITTTTWSLDVNIPWDVVALFLRTEHPEAHVSFEASRVEFTPIVSRPYSAEFGALEVRATRMPQVVLGEKLQLAAGVEVAVRGEARLDLQAGAVTAGGLGRSGRDGLAIGLDPVSAVFAALAPIDPAGAAPAGAFLVAEARGELSGVPDQPLGSLTITKAGGGDSASFELATSFTGLGTSQQRLQIFRQGNLIHEEVLPAGPAARASAWPEKLGKLGGETECYVAKFPEDNLFTFLSPSRPAIPGDEVRLLAENGAPVGAKTSFGLRAAGIGEFTVTEVSVGDDAGCRPGPAILCLNSGRFQVEAEFTAPDGLHGSAQAVPLSADSGYFYFFSPANVELVVKVLDGCAINDRFWAISAGLTDVEVELKITDTVTGAVQRYSNPMATPYRPVLDTGAFATCGASAVSGEADPARSAEVAAAELARVLATLGPRRETIGDSADAGELLLGAGRFRVRTSFRTALGQTGPGQAVPLTEETGLFWFFSPSNLEVAVKVLDGCAINHRYWVFAAGLTDVEVTMTVTDTVSGTTRTYSKTLGTPFEPVLDLAAFAACP